MAKVELVVPKVGESVTEAVVAKWLKNVGDAIAVDEPVVEIETDKVTVALPAPQGGVLVEQSAATGATVKVGQVIGTIDSSAKSASPSPTPSPSPGSGPGPGSGFGSGHVPPSVRRGLRPDGNHRAAATAVATPGPTPIVKPNGGEEVVPMSTLRRRIAERLVEAQKSAAILTTFNEVDMSAVMALRATHQDAFVKKHGIKLGFMSFFAKASVEALKEFPGLNAEIRGTDIVYKKYYHLGVAVGGGKGLVVPVLRNVDQLSFAEIEKAIAALAEKAKQNTLTLEDLTGGTFSITNGGIYGSMMSTPLINPPQTGILGMHNIIKRPIAVSDEVALRPMMYIALSYDHRVVDGREAVQFLVGVKQRIETPERMLLSI